MREFDVRPVRGKAPGDQYSDWIDRFAASPEPVESNQHPMDTEKAHELHSRLLSWYYMEREKQSANRLEMATDHAFYDNEQWDAEDAATLKDRGQMPLVYNEVAPMCDWMIGTERRTRVDWKVLPRAEDDVQAADIKTKVLKFVSDVNRVPFTRSRAFADAIKGGIGWLDDGARDDPTADIIYDKYEDWRNVLHDSAGYELDLTDARFVFRWRWVDEDIACMMFPDRADQIRQACEEAGSFSTPNEEDSWYLGENLNQREKSGTIYAAGAGVMVDSQRRRVKLIECQYREPCSCKMVADGPMKGAFLHDADATLQQMVAQQGLEVVDKVMMRVHFAVFTEAHMIASAPSIYRHNRFTLTPIWCYRNSRTRLPYGVIRRVRDIQQDLNKRASKALFMLNTNQIIADEGATDDWNALRDEADRPDGILIKKAGKELVLRRDTDAATGQIQMMTLAAQSIQKTAGVNNENLGRQTNAISGAAIEARQNQGAVGTTEPFDNHRLAVQIQGEKMLSLVEQFYSEQKVIRLTGAKGAIEWVKVNQPEQQPDGSIRWINDITASQADFVVSEADYAGSLRQVMFDSLQQMATKLPPEISIRLMTIALEFSDLPNHNEIADSLRRLTGDRDPSKELSPEEQQAEMQKMQMQGEAMQMQREGAQLALEEQRAKVAKLNAEAQALMAGQPQGGMPPEVEQAIRQVQDQAAQQIDRLSEQLAKAQSDLANRTLQISRDADVKLEIANIQADKDLRIAEMARASDKQLTALETRMASIVESLAKKLDEKEAAEEKREAERQATEKERAKAEKEKTKEKPIEKEKPATPAPVQPITLNIQVDAKPEAGGKKKINVKRDAEGNMIGAEVEEE